MSVSIYNDNYRYQVYMNENKGWRKLLDLQSRELPQLEKFLADAVYETSVVTKENERETVAHFRDCFYRQAEELKALHEGIEAQQKRLSADCRNHTVYDIDSICEQDLLRERICKAEQKFAELKSNFMTYLSNII